MKRKFGGVAIVFWTFSVLLALAFVGGKIWNGLIFPIVIAFCAWKLWVWAPSDQTVKHSNLEKSSSERSPGEQTFRLHPSQVKPLPEVRILIDYGDRDGQETDRYVHTQKLELVDGVWYLRAYCELRQEERTFRLDRIHRLEVAGSPAEPWSFLFTLATGEVPLST